MKNLKVASFFSGIGGFDVGFEKAGFEINLQCEINKFCQSVLKHHWPSVDFLDDISTAQAKSIPDADVWCGGFPCQDLSVARGSLARHGLNGSRSGLFFSLAALAEKKKPRAILIENVHGLLSANNGKDFAELLRILGNLKYAVSWRLLNSRYFGVPQSRPRVYICAWLNDPIAAGNVLFEDRAPVVLPNERSAFLETSWTSGPGPITPKVAFCLAATSGRHTGTDWSRTYVAYEKAVRRLTPLECERLQGFVDNWTQLDHPKIDIERADSLRYHALGNAVSIPVIKWIADRIHKQFSVQVKPAGKAFGKNDFMVKALELWPGLLDSIYNTGELADIQKAPEKIMWANAGILWNGAFISSQTPPSLNKPVQSDLLDIIEQQMPNERYFLSPKAAEGILRRVDSQGRQLFPLLRQALEKLAGRKPSIYRIPRTSPQLELGVAEPACA
jgi:DNA (cytosine-5)-methyltransferase 1